MYRGGREQRGSRPGDREAYGRFYSGDLPPVSARLVDQANSPLKVIDEEPWSFLPRVEGNLLGRLGSLPCTALIDTVPVDVSSERKEWLATGVVLEMHPRSELLSEIVEFDGGVSEGFLLARKFKRRGPYRAKMTARCNYFEEGHLDMVLSWETFDLIAPNPNRHVAGGSKPLSPELLVAMLVSLSPEGPLEHKEGERGSGSAIWRGSPSDESRALEMLQRLLYGGSDRGFFRERPSPSPATIAGTFRETSSRQEAITSLKREGPKVYKEAHSQWGNPESSHVRRHKQKTKKTQEKVKSKRK